MKIGIATCDEKPNLTEGDRIFMACLEKRGVQATPLIWDSPVDKNSEFDAIVIRSTWDYHKNYQEFAKWIGDFENSPIKLVNSPEVVRWNLDKAYLYDFEPKRISIVPSMLFAKDLATAAILEQIQNSDCDELVIKPTISATAFLTFRCSASDPDLVNMIDQVKAHSDILVQPYLPSVEEDGEVSLIFFNNQRPEYSHSVLKLPKGGDFRVQSDFGGSYQLFQPSHELMAFAESCLGLIKGDWAFARVDIVDWKREPLLSELELIEPDLFLTTQPNAAEKLVDAVLRFAKS